MHFTTDQKIGGSRDKKASALILELTAHAHVSPSRVSMAGAVVRELTSHHCGPGLIPRLGVICGLSLLVLYSAPRGFSPGTPVFPSPQKPTFDLS